MECFLQKMGITAKLPYNEFWELSLKTGNTFLLLLNYQVIFTAHEVSVSPSADG
jgi:hypothetical protein